MLADVICYWKMTSFMALDGVTLFLSLKDITNTCKHMRHSLSIGGVLQCNGGKLKELKISNVFSSFIAC